MKTRSLRLQIAAGLLFSLVAGRGTLDAQRVEPEGIRGARRPHAELPLGRTDHAAAVVDEYFESYWQSRGVSPASVVDDATYLRRVSLALHGAPAPPDDVVRFEKDESPTKRAAIVDSLLTHSRYADYWGFRLRSWITEMRQMLGQSTNLATLYFYTREAMALNHSWSRIATDLLARDGEVTYRGYSNFSLYFDCEPNEVAEAASRLFLGVNLSCAQCHDHPHVEELSQESYWGFAAYFAKIYIGFGKPTYEKRFPELPRNPAGISTLPGGDWSVDGIWGDDRGILEDAKREVKFPDPANPRTMKPRPLGGDDVDNADAQELSRREQLAAWLTRDENPYFARAAVNRFWTELTGFGFVDAVDGFTPQGAVRHPKLLDELARQFNANQHDIKWLLRTILLSRVFQQSESSDSNVRETWIGWVRRPLNSDQWHDSVLRVTGEDARIYEIADHIAELLDTEHAQRILVHADPSLLKKEKVQAAENAREDTKLSELRAQYDEIGKRLRRIRESLRIERSPTNEALLWMNGELVAASLRHGLAPGEIAKLATARKRLDRVYLSTLGRLPTNAERSKLIGAVEEPSAERAADVMWALLQSTEFLTY